MKQITHRFIREFGRFTVTATIMWDQGKSGGMTLEWQPEMPKGREILAIMDDYKAWMLDNYKVIAEQAGEKVGYVFQQPSGKFEFWAVYPDGRAEMVSPDENN